MNEILCEGKSLQPSLIECYHTLHRNGEVGFELSETVAFVKKKLDEIGVSYSDCGKCGITALIGDKSSEKAVLLRADMDALPIREETGLDFACSNGNMHACGHDMHTSMLLGAAKILKSREKELKGAVKLMFQPAEEIMQGASNMIENGVLKCPGVKGAMMLHVVTGVSMETGTFIVSSGGISAPSADFFTINVHGKSSHGSTPNKGIDAISVASHILIALQEISARELNISDEVIVTVGSFHGGKAGNILADSVTMQGTIRAFDDDIRAFVKKRIEEITSDISKAFRAVADVSYNGGCPTLLNDEDVSNSVSMYLKEVFGYSSVITTSELSESDIRGGSDDFACISHQVKSVMVALGAGNQEKGYKYVAHHPKVCFDEEALWRGAVAYAYCAIRFLEDN